MMRLVTGAAVLLCMITVLPNDVRAQDNSTRSDEQLAIDLERSEQLHRQAFESEIDQNNWSRAAELYLESARLRPYGDMKAYVALDRAAKLFYHTGKMRAAHRAFAAAGLRALETDRVYEAALAFASAAEASQEDTRDLRLGPDYLRTVHRLSQSPTLTPNQRMMIRQRAGLGGG